jgi:DNA-binding LacI/PurR family transcriptional regulator
MVQLTDYVYEKGYRKPMFMAGPNTYSAHLMRQDTFVRRWIELTGEEPEVTEVGVYDSNKAYYVTDEILRSRSKEDRPDVFVCENDAIAIGTLDCVRHGHKIAVPEEIAVTGFDDVELASNPNYDLTTFRQPISEMAEALVDVLQSTEEKSDLEKFGGYLVVRSSA